MRRLLYSLPIFISLVSPLAGEQNPLQQMMIKDLESARNIVEAKYAPMSWKKSHLNWDLQNEFENARKRIINENPKTDKEYQKIFRQFLHTTKDYHVQSFFYSSAWTFFPLEVKSCDNRYFVQNYLEAFGLTENEIIFEWDPIDENRFGDEKQLPKIQRGDELIAINETPIPQLIEQIIDNDLDGDRSPTGYSIAEKILFLKRGFFGHQTPSGTFTITVIHKGTDAPATYELPWLHIPEWVKEQNFPACSPMQAAKMAVKPVQKNKKLTRLEKISQIGQMVLKDFSVEFVKDLVSHDAKKMLSSLAQKNIGLEINSDEDEEDNEPSDLRQKGELPPIGKILWETSIDRTIYAYLAENEQGQKIGYIYLPSFNYAEMMAEQLTYELVDIITYFNQESQALVFDISNNPGGNLFFMYAVLSTLTDHPLRTPFHSETLIQQDAYVAASAYSLIKSELQEQNENENKESESEEQGTLHGYACNKQLIQELLNYFQFVLKSWEAGETFTQPFPICGITDVMPHPKAQYAKPLILLTNEMCFSCGDFFPAILQDNGRATVLGKRTAGAGGCVRPFDLTSQFGIKSVRLTSSIGYRLNGQPVENLGVTPDIPYELTINDLQNNYADYIQKINFEVNKLLK